MNSWVFLKVYIFLNSCLFVKKNFNCPFQSTDDIVQLFYKKVDPTTWQLQRCFIVKQLESCAVNIFDVFEMDWRKSGYFRKKYSRLYVCSQQIIQNNYCLIKAACSIYIYFLIKKIDFIARNKLQEFLNQMCQMENAKHSMYYA